MTPTHQQVLSIHGHRVRVRIEGAGEPLLLLNGLLRPLESWTPFTQAVAHRTVIAFDVPGTGASSTPMFPVSMHSLAAVASSVLDAAGFAKADVVGFSHGGAIAQQMAVDSPTRVRSLVLAATSCGIGAITGDAGDLCRAALTPPKGSPWPLPDPLGVFWQLLAISTWSSMPFLAQINAPTLVVCGTHDRVVPPANSVLLADHIPHARLAAIEAGHDLQRAEHAPTLAALVDHFVTTG